MSILEPKTSVMVGVSTAALVGFTYSYGLPNLAIISATDPGDINIESGRRKAAFTSVALVAAITLLTKDRTVFVIGGATVVFLDWQARHANATPANGTKVLSQLDYRAPVDEQEMADSYEYDAA